MAVTSSATGGPAPARGDRIDRRGAVQGRHTHEEVTMKAETPGMARNRFLFVFVLSVLLLGLAHGLAEWKGRQDARWRERLAAEGGAHGTARALHTTTYYR